MLKEFSTMRSIRIRSCSFALAVGVASVSGVASADFLTEAAFPLNTGRIWHNLRDSTTPEDEEVLPGPLQLINGVATTVVDIRSMGSPIGTENVTNDAFGFQVHRVTDQTVTSTFSPPIQFLSTSFDVGTVVTSSGNATYAGFGTFPYSTTTTVTGIETTTVPYGTFDAVVIDQLITIASTSATARFYLVPHIGPVRVVSDVFNQLGEFTSSELTALTVPEPGALQGLLPAVAFLGCLSRRQRRE